MTKLDEIVVEHMSPIDACKYGKRLALKDLEKVVCPKTPITNYTDSDKIHSYECPTCNKYIEKEYNYCPNCSQALKWD